MPVLSKSWVLVPRELVPPQKVYYKIESCEGNSGQVVASSNLVIGRPWTPRATHCVTNQPVCRMTTHFDMAAPLLLSSISAFEKSPLPVREYDSSSSGNSTRIGRFPSYSMKPPIVAKNP